MLTVLLTFTGFRLRGKLWVTACFSGSAGCATHISWSKCCLCVDVNQSGTNRNRCTQTCYLVCRDLPVNPHHKTKIRSVWPNLRVKIACRKKWAWIGIFKPAEPHISWDACCSLFQSKSRFIAKNCLVFGQKRNVPCRLDVACHHSILLIFNIIFGWSLMVKMCIMEYSVTLRRWPHVNSMHILHLPRPTSLVLKRCQSDTSAEQTTDGERRLVAVLQRTFPKASEICVHDISGSYRQ